MESTPVVSIHEVPVKDVFTIFRTFSDFAGMYTWKYQWKPKSRKRQLLVVLLMSHACINIALQLYNFIRLLFLISWNMLATGTEMVRVTYCLTYLISFGLNTVCITSARNNWDLLLEKLYGARGTVGRRLVKFYKLMLGLVLIDAVGYSAYIYTSLSEPKPGDEMDILTVCRMAPITPDMFIWNIFKVLIVLTMLFMRIRTYYLQLFYLLAAYHIVQEFKLLKKKVIGLNQLGRYVTFDIVKDLRLQYEHSVSLTRLLDSLLTWHVFLSYSLLLPNIFALLYGLLRVSWTQEEFPAAIEFLALASIFIAILTLAATSINTASKGMEDVLYQIGIDWSDDKTIRAYQTFLSRVSNSDVGITALGFFTISKGTVLTMIGTIVSYIVVILQFPTSSDSLQTQTNATLHP